MGAANQANVTEGHSLDTPLGEVFGYANPSANMESGLQSRTTAGRNSESIQRLAASHKQSDQEKAKRVIACT